MRKAMVLWIFLIHISFVFAQDMSSFLFRKYQVNDGLSENTVTSIYQDKKGFLWLGTKDGLNKFDGINFTVYRNKFDNKSLGNNFVKSIADSGDSILYIGTNDGVYIMNRHTETFELLEQRLKVADKIITIVTSLLLDKQGRLWISSMYQGIYVFDPHKTELSRVRCSSFDLTKTNTWTIFMDKSGGIWAGTRIGLLQYNANNGMFEPVGDLTNYSSTSNMEVFKIFEDQKGNLWLGTWSDGILCYNKQQKSHAAFCTINSNDFYITHIRDFLEYDVSSLLIGSDDGLYLFNMETNKTMRIDIPYEGHSLGDQNVYSLLRDREKGIWVGTYFGGLNYLSPNNMNIKTYLPSQRPGGLSGKAISQFCEDKNRNLWIATEDGGVNYFDTKTERFTQPIHTSYHNIHSLMLDNDQLWIGTFSRGIDIYNTQTKAIKNYRHNQNDEKSLNDDCVFSIYKTKDGEIYVGTTIGLNRYNSQEGNFVRINSDSISFVYDIKEDSYKNLWIASYKNGVVKYDYSKKRWIYYSEILDKSNPIVNSRLTGIYIDDKKRVWFSSEGDGVFQYDYAKDNFTNISEIEGLPNNVTYGLLDDQFGNLWISSNRGLVSFSPSNLADQKIVLQEDGLQGNEFNYKSSLKASDGRMYFGGINGFNSFYPQRLKENTNHTVPTVEITGLKLLGSQDGENQEYIRRSLSRHEPIELKYNNSSINISYISLSYVSQSKNQYAYKLEGVDEDWIYVGNNKNVTYVNLSPGKYTFKVKASNNHGVWSTEDAVLNFEILPPFWLSVPAKVFYTLSLLLMGYYLMVYLIKRNRIRQQRQLENFKTEQEKVAFKSKIDFFTNIAHEIRTPVSLIKAPLEEIILSRDGNSETKQNLSIIEKNSDRLNVLINQLLDFRKMESDEYSININKLDLKKHLTELYERFKKTAQNKEIDFELVLQGSDEVLIISDADALIKIIGNFLTNALKYTKDKITLELSPGIEGYSYLVTVSDNGEGIPEKLHTKIFDPFYQIQPSGNKKGTGIGLFLAKHLAEVLKGEIKVSNNPEGGVTFSFLFNDLPLEVPYDDNVFVQQEKAEALPDYRHEVNEKQNILIVEDNIDMLHFIENCLKADYNVDCAESAAEAIKLIDQKLYNLLITDIMMPDIDGLEFTRHLRGNINYSHIPVILLSAKTDNNTKIEGLNAGADVFLEKPFSTTYLKAQISSLLANRKAILEAFNRSPLTSYSVLTTNKHDRDFIDKLNSEIDQHISDSNFSIESLTDKLFISRSNLQRKLKSICGYTPGEYLRTYRLRKAATLLLKDEMRVNEVAFEVGFSSSSYFTKCFIKQFGVLPKDFTKRHLEDLKNNAVDIYTDPSDLE